MMRMDNSPKMLGMHDARSPQTPTLTEGLYKSNDSFAPIAYNSKPGQTTGSSASTGSDDDPGGSQTIEFIQV